jgi:hypothetical protein
MQSYSSIHCAYQWSFYREDAKFAKISYVSSGKLLTIRLMPYFIRCPGYFFNIFSHFFSLGNLGVLAVNDYYAMIS